MEIVPHIGSRIGKGRKLDLYVPADDLWVIDEIERRVSVVKRRGYKTSFNFEVLGLLKFAVKRKKIKP